MDIHKPKPWHGLREFLKEYLIIVAGIATALAGEQTVEWLHWRHEVSETEHALKSELGRNLSAWEFRLSEDDCVRVRIADLERWRDGWIGGKGRALTGAIGAPIAFNYFTDSWEVAQSGQVAAHIPLERRMLYAKAYALFRQTQADGERDRDSWRSLRDFNGATSLDGHDLMRLNGLISQLKGFESGLANNLSVAQRRAALLGVVREPLEGLSQAQRDTARAAMCKSVLPA